MTGRIVRTHAVIYSTLTLAWVLLSALRYESHAQVQYSCRENVLNIDVVC